MAASRRNRYYKSLKGVNAQGFFSASVVYTAATTFSAFVAGVAAGTIANGTIAIINETTSAVVTGALSAGTKYFIAQAVDGTVKKSTTLTAGTGVEVKKSAYSAPVLQQVIVGYNGTSGSIGTIVPSAGNKLNLVLTVRDMSPANMPFPVQAGNITVKSSTATKYDVVASLVTDLGNTMDPDGDNDLGFARIEMISNGTKTAIATVTATCIEGSPQITYSGAHTLAVGDILDITLNGVTRCYKVMSVPSTTIAVLDRAFAGASGTTAGGGTAKVTLGTEYGIVITAYVEDTNFSVAQSGDLSATVTTVTAWKQGSGASWQVAGMEEECQVFAGWTTGNAPFVSDMGKPTSFVNPEGSTNYNLWFLKYTESTASMAYPNQNTHHVGYVILAAPTSGNTPTANFDTILGT